MDGDEHVRDWAALHLTEPPGGFVGGWLRAAAAVARPLARAGVSPNAVTVAALVAAVAAVPLAMIDGWPGPAAACVAVTVSGLLDSLDGAVAVQAGRTTKVGFLLDSVLDRLADAAFPAALAIAAGGGTGPTRLAVAAAAACWWLEYVRARGSLAGVTGKQVITPGERPTRIILTAVGLGLPFLATAALWGSVVIVAASGLFLFGSSLRRLRAQDDAPDARLRPEGDDPPAPTGAS
ncbi:MAG TPA: CDP-alcohol phosphatidyltransferase family protein [Acidimicrobiales bacterium]|jgi:phosphatidylglycerophosphate synthase|nr:CDP-alcohol phosphatidyltransferase family protein [Acidimicrobiales bacterium]